MGESPFSKLRSAESLRQLVERLHEGIYVTRRDGVILDANPALLRMLGVASLEEVRRLKAEDLLVDPTARTRELDILDREGSVRDFEFQIRRRPNGEIRTVIDSSLAIPDPATGEVFYHGVLVDITDRKRLEEELADQTIRDPLTGCYNRRYLAEFEQKMGERGWGCIVLDIDYFKEYNDRFGHRVGDEVLTRVARFLMRQTRAEEGVVRLGGDEFVVLLVEPETTGADARDGAAQRTAARLQQLGARELPISFSLGWAARDDTEPLERTINRADHNLLAVRSQQPRQFDPERRRS